MVRKKRINYACHYLDYIWNTRNAIILKGGHGDIQKVMIRSYTISNLDYIWNMRNAIILNSVIIYLK